MITCDFGDVGYVSLSQDDRQCTSCFVKATILAFLWHAAIIAAHQQGYVGMVIDRVAMSTSCYRDEDTD